MIKQLTTNMLYFGYLYRVEIAVFSMLFVRSLSIYSRTSLKQHMEYSVLPFPVLNPV